MRWPWSRNGGQEVERRNYTDLIVSALLGAAEGTAADAAKTATVECVAGTLGRIMSAVKVEASSMVAGALTPSVLASIGYDAVRHGESLHVLSVDGGRLRLIRGWEWDWTDSRGDDPAAWRVRVETAGPNDTTSRIVAYDDLVFVPWGTSPREPWRGIAGHVRASETARMTAQLEKSMADEAAGPVGRLATVPAQSGDLEVIKEAVAKLRGGIAFVPTVRDGMGAGMTGAPARDMRPDRVGAAFDEALVKAYRTAAEGVAASLGYPPALLSGQADGTSLRESLRRLHLQLVLPFTRCVENELTTKLETPVRLVHDSYALDMVSRATVVDKLVRAGVPTATALEAVGIE